MCGESMILYEAERSVQSEYLYHQFDDNLSFQKHTHHSYEAVFCLGGELFCESDNIGYTLHRGEGVLILPGHIHSYKTKIKSKSYLCVFSPDLVASFYEKTKSSNFSNVFFTFSGQKQIEILTNEKISIYSKQAVLYELCGKIFEQSEISSVDASYFALTNSLSMYIQNNFTKDIKLKTIAKEFGYDYSYISSFFNRNFGMDFSSFVNNYRIRFAKSFLEKSELTITEVAMKSGFTTIRNFNLVFKEMTGVTPGMYRKMKFETKK